MNEVGAETERLEEDTRRTRNWKRWGPYLSERQWGTVREDYLGHHPLPPKPGRNNEGDTHG